MYLNCFIFAGLDNIHLKVLIPSIAAGAIIGKGGETITQIQKETGAVIKMSKANDFYPGKSLTHMKMCVVILMLDMNYNGICR